MQKDLKAQLWDALENLRIRYIGIVNKLLIYLTLCWKKSKTVVKYIESIWAEFFVIKMDFAHMFVLF